MLDPSGVRWPVAKQPWSSQGNRMKLVCRISSNRGGLPESVEYMICPYRVIRAGEGGYVITIVFGSAATFHAVALDGNACDLLCDTDM